MSKNTYKAKDAKTGIWYKDGDLFSNGHDSKRKYPCKVTNHGILYTKTHVDSNDSIVYGEDGREGYTDWDYDTLYTDVILCRFVTTKNGVDIYEGDFFTFKYLRDLGDEIELKGYFIYHEDELRYEIEILDSDKYIVLSYVSNGTMRDFQITGENIND